MVPGSCSAANSAGQAAFSVRFQIPGLRRNYSKLMAAGVGNRGIDNLSRQGEAIYREIQRVHHRAERACSGQPIPAGDHAQTVPRAEHATGWLRAEPGSTAYWDTPSDYSAYPQKYDPKNTVNDPERDPRDYSIFDCEDR